MAFWLVTQILNLVAVEGPRAAGLQGYSLLLGSSWSVCPRTSGTLWVQESIRKPLPEESKNLSVSMFQEARFFCKVDIWVLWFGFYIFICLSNIFLCFSRHDTNFPFKEMSLLTLHVLPCSTAGTDNRTTGSFRPLGWASAIALTTFRISYT